MSYRILSKVCGENIEEVGILEVTGLCAICGRPAKLYTCPLCGKSVCSQCMDLKKGICIRCASGRAGHPVHGLGDTERL